MTLSKAGTPTCCECAWHSQPSWRSCMCRRWPGILIRRPPKRRPMRMCSGPLDKPGRAHSEEDHSILAQPVLAMHEDRRKSQSILLPLYHFTRDLQWPPRWHCQTMSSMATGGRSLTQVRVRYACICKNTVSHISNISENTGTHRSIRHSSQRSSNLWMFVGGLPVLHPQTCLLPLFNIVRELM